MAVGWIDNVVNNTPCSWLLKSVDDHHNGVLTTGKQRLVLDDAAFHTLTEHTHYVADWCGIPWYFQGKHYKVLSKDGKGGVRFYTSEIGDENWIIFDDDATLRPIARQSVPKGSDFHCVLRFEEDGVFFDVVNNNQFSGEQAVHQIYSEAKLWVQIAVPAIAASIAGAA